MNPKSLEEIWEAETYYDELRWSSEESVFDLDTQTLETVRADIGETIRCLSDNWLYRKLRSSNIRRIKRLRRKLSDFQWQITQEYQFRERSSQHYQRVEDMWNPQPRDEQLPSPNYGVKGSLVATPFYRVIGSIFNPIPRNGGGS